MLRCAGDEKRENAIEGDVNLDEDYETRSTGICTVGGVYKKSTCTLEEARNALRGKEVFMGCKEDRCSLKKKTSKAIREKEICTRQKENALHLLFEENNKRYVKQKEFAFGATEHCPPWKTR